MATRRPRTPSSTSTAVQAVPENRVNQRVKIDYIDINDITPYEWNPRDNSEAVSAVAASIKQFGFAIPVVVDANNVLIAGHTRIEAAKTLGFTEVPVVRADYLTPEQANAFRVVDNKVAEQASWNYELLAGEIAKLDGLGFDFTDFGWEQTDLDCMSQLVAADCLSISNLVPVVADSTGAASARRGPQHTRVVVGDFVFFVPMEVWRTWSDGIRHLCNFDEAQIEAELRTRLGMPQP